MSTIEPRSAMGGGGLGLGGASTASGAALEDSHPAVCVMEVPGTAIEVRDIDGGVAVVFDTVAPERVVELRRAVTNLVRAYEEGRRVAQRHDHSPRALELGRRYRALVGELPPLRAVVQEVSGGAQLEVRATDPASVAALRQKMQAEVSVMQRGLCPLAPPEE